MAVTQRTIEAPKGTILLTDLLHVSGGRLTSSVLVGQPSSSPQQFGAALTYLRRYELSALLGITSEDDDDAQTVTPRKAAPKAAPVSVVPAPKLSLDDATTLAARIVDHGLGDNLVKFASAVLTSEPLPEGSCDELEGALDVVAMLSPTQAATLAAKVEDAIRGQAA